MFVTDRFRTPFGRRNRENVEVCSDLDLRDVRCDRVHMELVWSNAQSELTALERGLHSGMDVKAYAASACRDRVKVQREVMAAKVSEAVFRPVPVQYQ